MEHSSPTAEVSKLHIRTHDGNDAVWTPGYDDYDKVNESGIAKPIWGFGGEGNDFISGGDEPDKIYGGNGDDRELLGRAGDDEIWGGPGNDIIEGHGGGDAIYGQGGDDIIEGWGNVGQDVFDIIYGDYHHEDPRSGSDDGDDIIIAGMDESFTGVTADGVDKVYGGGGNDRIDGYKGNDELWGDYHPDDPHSDPENELFGQGAGNDEIYGWVGNDKIYGGPGHDNLFGEDGNDELYGNEGSDHLYGGPGNDTLYGHEDSDYFVGGDGSDTYADYDPGEDWRYDPPNYEDERPRIDLVTDIPGGYGTPDVFEAYPGSWDNREENGFHGGKHILAGSLAEMQIHLDDPQHNLAGKKLKLDWEGDEEVIKVYLDPEGTQRIYPGHTWIITDPWEPISIYVEGLSTGVGQYAALTLTLLKPCSSEPVPGRPLQDFVFVNVI